MGRAQVGRDEPEQRPRRRGRPAGEDRLSREIVLTTAVELALATSLDEVSIRKIAAQLGVSAMAIYNHVASKAEIERHLLGHLFKSEVGRVDLERVQDGPDILRAVFRDQFKLTLKYPDIFVAFTHHSTMPEVLLFQEQMYEGFRRCGLPYALHRIWARVFGSFVNGSVALHNVTLDETWRQLESAYQHLDNRLYPNLAAARAATPDTHIELFDVELDVLIQSLLLTIREISTEGGTEPASAGGK
jgi:AcrR family transcriptional regulator